MQTYCAHREMCVCVCMSHTHTNVLSAPPSTSLTHELRGRVSAHLWRARFFSLTGALEIQVPRINIPVHAVSPKRCYGKCLPHPPPRSSRPPPDYSGGFNLGCLRGSGFVSRRHRSAAGGTALPKPQTPASAAALPPPRRGTWCAARQSAAPAHATRRDNSTHRQHR